MYPCFSCLPKGFFSWSLYHAPRANTVLSVSAEPWKGAAEVYDGGCPVVFCREKGGGVRLAFFVYMGNLGIIGADKAAVNAAIAVVEAALSRNGLTTNEMERAASAAPP